jgi:hypothetical protein
MKQGKRRCTPEKRRRLVAVLDRSERDVLRRSEGARGVPESIRSAPERLLRHPPRPVDEPQLDYEFIRADREKGDTIRKQVQPCAA